MISYMKSKIHDFLLEKMAVNGWSQQELADKIGVSKGTISRWINQPGENELDLSSLKKIAAALQLPLQEVVDVTQGIYKPLSKRERDAIEIRKRYDAETIRLAFEQLE
jgi:transcriptional regulator with XRE-family HTH domain